MAQVRGGELGAMGELLVESECRDGHRETGRPCHTGKAIWGGKGV